mgnify:CR=1 FL=1|tara:strand:- start:78 stop:305 length:228 start_codon:yes stop_codon:yes gene_type:complete
MTHKEFIFWLKGIADSSATPPTKKTWKIIQDKLNQIKGEETEEDKQPEIYIQPTNPQPQTTPEIPNPGNPPQIWC